MLSPEGLLPQTGSQDEAFGHSNENRKEPTLYRPYTKQLFNTTELTMLLSPRHYRHT